MKSLDEMTVKEAAHALAATAVFAQRLAQIKAAVDPPAPPSMLDNISSTAGRLWNPAANDQAGLAGHRAILGAGVGAGAGLLSGAMSTKRKKNYMGRALTGAALGGMAAPAAGFAFGEGGVGKDILNAPAAETANKLKADADARLAEGGVGDQINRYNPAYNPVTQQGVDANDVLAGGAAVGAGAATGALAGDQAEKLTRKLPSRKPTYSTEDATQALPSQKDIGGAIDAMEGGAGMPVRDNEGLQKALAAKGHTTPQQRAMGLSDLGAKMEGRLQVLPGEHKRLQRQVMPQYNTANTAARVTGAGLLGALGPSIMNWFNGTKQ